MSSSIAAKKGEADILTAALATSDKHPSVANYYDCFHDKLSEMNKFLNSLIEQAKALPSKDSQEVPLDTSAYEEAMKRTPELVETESNPLLFLRREDGDVKAASQRLITYWTYRKNLFGPDRAYLPLKLGGAITEAEQPFLRSACFTRLPNDRQGHAVLFYDMSRRPKGFGEKARALESRARGIFFVISQAISNPLSQTEGIVLLAKASEKTSTSVHNRPVVKDLLAHVMPIRVKCLHVACLPPPGMKRLFITQIVPNNHFIAGGNTVTKTVIPHFGKSPEDLLKKLEARGFEMKNLPESVGGTWSDQDWVDYCQGRVVVVVEMMDGKTVVREEETANAKDLSTASQDGKPQAQTSQGKEDASSKKGQDGCGGGFASLLLAASQASSGADKVATSAMPSSNKKAQALEAATPRGQTMISPKVLMMDSSAVYRADKLAKLQNEMDKLVQSYYARDGPQESECSAYAEATKKCPELIARESNPLYFLRHTEADVKAAGRLLLSYWSYRKDIFGSTKAFLPMKLGGALSTEEMESLRAAPFARLPPDAYGRDVLCADLTRRPKGAGDENLNQSRARTVFYVLSLCCANPLSQTDGVVFLSCLSEKSPTTIPDKDILRDLLLQAMPIRVHMLHIACHPRPGMQRLFREQLIPMSRKSFAGGAMEDVAVVEMGKTKKDVCKQLVAQGFEKKHLPRSVGGTWDYVYWVKFLDIDLSTFDATTVHQAASVTTTFCSVKAPPGSAIKPLSETASKASRGRKIQAKTASRKAKTSTLKKPECQDEKHGKPKAKRGKKAPPSATRPKKKARSEVSKESSKGEATEPVAVGRPRDGYKILSKDVSLPSIGIPTDQQYNGPFSEDIIRNLDSAMASVPAECFKRGETEEEKAAFIRKRNAIYSKRKYYRKKVKIESLLSSKADLAVANEQLRKDNRRLELLCEEAERIVADPGVAAATPAVSFAKNEEQEPQSQATDSSGDASQVDKFDPQDDKSDPQDLPIEKELAAPTAKHDCSRQRTIGDLEATIAQNASSTHPLSLPAGGGSSSAAHQTQVPQRTDLQATSMPGLTPRETPLETMWKSYEERGDPPLQFESAPARPSQPAAIVQNTAASSQADLSSSFLPRNQPPTRDTDLQSLLRLTHHVRTAENSPLMEARQQQQQRHTGLALDQSEQFGQALGRHLQNNFSLEIANRRLHQGQAPITSNLQRSQFSVGDTPDLLLRQQQQQQVLGNLRNTNDSLAPGVLPSGLSSSVRCSAPPPSDRRPATMQDLLQRLNTTPSVAASPLPPSTTTTATTTTDTLTLQLLQLQLQQQQHLQQANNNASQQAALQTALLTMLLNGRNA